MLAAGLVACYDDQNKQTGQSVNKNGNEQAAVEEVEKLKAPPFTLTSLSGEEVSLADLEGKVVLLNFWTTWCPYCKVDMPGIDSLYAKYKEEGFVVLAVNLTASEKSPVAVKKFVNESGYAFPVLLDGSGDVAVMYNVNVLPTSFLINRQGQVVYSRVGSFPSVEMEGLLKKHL